MADSVLQVDRSNKTTAILTLNRPDKRNALTIELMETLCQELASLASEPYRRVAVLRGAGPVFCAGLDLLEAAETKVAERSAQCVANTLQAVANSPLVTIAAAHGAAYAGGAGLMSACDFVVASEDLRICFPEVRRGLIPALVSTILGDRVRDAQLRELLLLAEPIDAQQALKFGLVHRVVARHEMLDAALRISSTIERGAPEAIRQTKRLLGELRGTSSAALVQKALEYHTRARNSDEAREGLQAFREGRDPNW